MHNKNWTKPAFWNPNAERSFGRSCFFPQQIMIFKMERSNFIQYVYIYIYTYYIYILYIVYVYIYIFKKTSGKKKHSPTSLGNPAPRSVFCSPWPSAKHQRNASVNTWIDGISRWIFCWGSQPKKNVLCSL